MAGQQNSRIRLWQPQPDMAAPFPCRTAKPSAEPVPSSAPVRLSAPTPARSRTARGYGSVGARGNQPTWAAARLDPDALCERCASLPADITALIASILLTVPVPEPVGTLDVRTGLMREQEPADVLRWPLSYGPVKQQNAPCGAYWTQPRRLPGREPCARYQWWVQRRLFWVCAMGGASGALRCRS